MLEFRKFIVNILFILLGSTSTYAALSPLEILLTDMQQYRTTNARFHAGHVFEHSVWVSRASINLLNSAWRTKCETREEIRNVILASLLHDLGKCGDGIHEFNEKPGHPLQGFEYLIGIREYRLATGGVYNFQELFKSLNLTCNDVAFIAIISGMHHDLGGLMRSINTGDSECFRRTMKKLDTYIEKSGYMGGRLKHDSKVYRKLVKYICLISASDVISAQVVAHTSCHDIISEVAGMNLGCSANARCQTLSDGLNGYEFFKYDTVGINARMGWLSFCV